MQKYVCNLCGYIYDPEIGDPDNGVASVRHLPICPKTGFAQIAELVRTISSPPTKVFFPQRKAFQGSLFCREPFFCFAFALNLVLSWRPMERGLVHGTA
jgi:rubredoxin